MKVLLFTFMLMALGLQAQNHTIKVYFLYGSKPAKCCKKAEKKKFGGLHGGHVSIGVDNEIVGFGPSGKFHIFSKDKSRHSHFRVENLSSFVIDTVGEKYTVVTLPVSADQYNKLKEIHTGYCKAPPYDYAFIGMRCASASYDILSQIDILKVRKRHNVMWSIFYPRRLRKKMLKLAKEKGYKVHKQQGKTTRVWEKD